MLLKHFSKFVEPYLHANFDEKYSLGGAKKQVGKVHTEVLTNQIYCSSTSLKQMKSNYLRY